MCIVALAWQVLPDLPVLMLSNRDEFYHRSANILQHWQNSPIYAGQDLEQGGTWMGVTAQGRWAVITNFREGNAERKNYPTSRGEIIKDFLQSDDSPMRFAQRLEQRQNQFAGFNLIIGHREQAIYMSNRGEAPQALAKGVYVLSNGLMYEHWEKTSRLRKRFTQELLPMFQNPQITEQERIIHAWDILQDQRKVAIELLPDTGISIDMEKLFSSTFIQSVDYGTRCSNILSMSRNDINWIEKTQHGQMQGHQQRLHLIG